MTEFGFVKIKSGQTSGRIGRFVGWDEHGIKAKVAFGYDNDILPYTNYRFYSINSITNDIGKQDLIERYFEIYQDLKAIDLRAHPRIKKYTADHTSIITECGMIRQLLHRFFNFKNLTLKNKEKNIIIVCKLLDILWVNEIALELEMAGFHVGIIDGEVFKDDLIGDLQEAIEFSDHYLFVEDYYKSQYQYIKNNLTSIYQSVTIAVIDEEDQDFENGYLYFGKVFSNSFEQSLRLLIERLESPEIYTRI